MYQQIGLFIASIVITLAALFLFRYEVISTGSVTNVHRLDRWTGKVTTCTWNAEKRDMACPP